MMPLPNIWTDAPRNILRKALGYEAECRFHRYVLPTERADWEAMRPGIREALGKAMGLEPAPAGPPKWQEYGVIQQDGYHIKKLAYESAGGRIVTANLYEPEGAGKFPAVINMHGHWQQGHLAARVQRRGHILAKSGYVVLTVDAFGSGERTTEPLKLEYHGGLRGGTLMNVGRTLMGIQAADNMRGVDLLCSLPNVDATRIGATGASGGGNQTMWLTALDERIKAAAVVVSAGSFASYVTNVNCICETLPDGLDICEESAVLALAAPRALLLCNAMEDKDPTFFVQEMLRSFGEARKVFLAYDAEDRFVYTACPGPHGYHEDALRSMFGFFQYHLRGIGNGRPRTFPLTNPLPESDLTVYEAGKRPADFVSIPVFIRKEAERLRAEQARSTPSAKDKRAELFDLLRLSALPPHTFRTARFAGKRDGWDAYTVETQSGWVLPALVRKPAKPDGTWRILAAERGFAQLENSTLRKDAPESGMIVFELSGTGAMDNDVIPEALPGLGHYHNIARGLMWMGRRMPGLWTADFLLMREFAASLGAESNRIIQGGCGMAGAAALFASIRVPCPRVETEDMPATFQLLESQFNTEQLTMAAILPGVLNWGDLSLAAALTTAETDFRSLRHSSGAALTDPEIARFRQEVADWKKRLN